MKAIQWPNKLGWDVGQNASVCDMVRKLAVRVGVRNHRYKYAYVPLGTDPVEAVRRCKIGGLTFKDRDTLYDRMHEVPLLES